MSFQSSFFQLAGGAFEPVYGGGSGTGTGSGSGTGTGQNNPVPVCTNPNGCKQNGKKYA